MKLKLPKIFYAVAAIILIFHAGFATIGAFIGMPLIAMAFESSKMPWLSVYAPFLMGFDIFVKLFFGGLCIKAARVVD